MAQTQQWHNPNTYKGNTRENHFNLQPEPGREYFLSVSLASCCSLKAKSHQTLSLCSNSLVMQQQHSKLGRPKYSCINCGSTGETSENQQATQKSGHLPRGGSAHGNNGHHSHGASVEFPGERKTRSYWEWGSQRSSCSCPALMEGFKVQQKIQLLMHCLGCHCTHCWATSAFLL